MQSETTKVLKGAFKAGRFAAMPRKFLVVLQFTVSVILINGTIVVFKQIQFANPPLVGYNRNGLVDIEVTNGDLRKNFTAVKANLEKSGAVSQIVNHQTRRPA